MITAAHVPNPKLVLAISYDVAELGRAAVGVRRTLRTETRRADSGCTVIVIDAGGIVIQVVHAISEGVAELARRAALVADTLGAKTNRADSGCTVIVIDAGGIVIQVVHAVSEGVAELARRAVVLADALGAESHRAVPRLALAVLEADMVVAEPVLAEIADIAVLFVKAPVFLASETCSRQTVGVAFAEHGGRTFKADAFRIRRAVGVAVAFVAAGTIVIAYKANAAAATNARIVPKRRKTDTPSRDLVLAVSTDVAEFGIRTLEALAARARWTLTIDGAGLSDGALRINAAISFRTVAILTARSTARAFFRTHETYTTLAANTLIIPR